MAPEVIRIKDEKSGPAAYYDFRCDTWALGVIVNMMLTGHWPFKLEQVAAYVAENVPLPDLDLTGLCTTAQDFISICLQPEFTKRPFPSDLIKHPFLNMTELIVPQNITPMAKRLNHFAHASAVKRAALTAAVRYLKGFEVEELRRRFELFDVDRDGTVTLKEFENAIEKCPQLLAAGDFESAEELFEAIDSDSLVRLALQNSLLLPWTSIWRLERTWPGKLSKLLIKRVMARSAARISKEYLVVPPVVVSVKTLQIFLQS
jgi:serine/threonine protein kinase